MRRLLSAVLFLLTVPAMSHATPILFSYAIRAGSTLGGVVHPVSNLPDDSLDLWILTDTSSFVPVTYTPPGGVRRVLYTTTDDVRFVVGYGGVAQALFTDAFTFRGIPGFFPPFLEQDVFDRTTDTTVLTIDASFSASLPYGVAFGTTAGPFEVLPGRETLVSADSTLNPDFPLPGMVATPEPSSLLLIGTGAAGVTACLRRRRGWCG